VKKELSITAVAAIVKTNMHWKKKDRLKTFFELPKVPLPNVRRTTKEEEPYIDCLKSIWMTQGDYLKSLE